MAMRITGMNSGMDTEAMVTELVKVSSSKKEKLEKAQTKLEWKQESWKAMNAKVYSFFSKKLTDLRFEGSYKKKKTTIADSKIASIVASDNAVNGTQTLAVESLAKSGYLTGGQMKRADADVKAPIYTTTTLKELTGDFPSDESTIDIRVTNSKGEEKTISFNAKTTIDEAVKSLKDAGINASFDEKNGRIFVNADGSGESKDFSIKAANKSGLMALDGLGLLSDSDFEVGSDGKKTYSNYKWGTETLPDGKEISRKPANLGALENKELRADGVRIKGQDAVIYLNGAKFTSDTNSFAINGLTITANSVSERAADKSLIETSINTADDVDGIYDMIKDFFKDYNELIKELEGAYNADKAKGYEPLTQDEKDAMSEKEVEDWEKKIKDSLLRRDQDLGTVINTLKNGMLSSFNVNGQKMSLSYFGINTLSYFMAADGEKGVYHIDGDKDDDISAANKDLLKSKIASEPDVVMGFFSKMVTGLYTSMNNLMQRNEYRSMYKVYDDKKLQKDYDSYKDKIKDQEKRLQALEDRYYDQFTSMEKAMGKLNSQSSYIAGLFQ